MRQLLLLILLVLVNEVSGQRFSYENWHEGNIVLEEGDTLRGKVKYNMQNDLLQYVAGSKVETYTPRKAVSFEIFDESAKQYRIFYSLPYNVSSEYRTPIFFELLTEGDITMLSREKLEYRTYSSTFFNYGTSTRLVLINEYYLLNENGSITQFVGSKSEWLDKMGSKGKDVERFAKTNRLNFDRKEDLIKIVNQYNSLAAK